jgi:hypothetical protein
VNLNRKLLMSGVAAGVVVTMVSLFSPAVRACIHMPELYEDSFEAQSQQSIVYHDGKLETLIVKIDAPTGGKAPAPGKPITLVEIIPVPGKPAGVQLDTLRLAGARASEDEQTFMGEQVFKDLKDLVDEYCKPHSRGIDMVDYGINPGREIIVGPYGIKLFDNSASGLKGLKDWVTARSLETSGGAVDSTPVKALDTELPAFKYYTSKKQDFTFCAVRVVDMNKALTPLEITFPSKQVFWPIKLTAAGSKASQNRDGSYTAYAITKAGANLNQLVEDFARHGLGKAEGFLDEQNKQQPLKVGEEAFQSRPGLEKLFNHLGLKKDQAQLMRFSGHFLGREAVRYEDDVFSSLK